MMKKSLIFATALALAFGAGAAVSAHQSLNRADAKTDNTMLFLKPNSNWKQKGHDTDPRFAAYFFGNGDTWVDMVLAEGGGSTGVYKVAIQDGYPSVIFCRMNGTTTANNWSNKYNQSGDLTISGNEGKLFTIPDDSWDGADSTNWSADLYNEPMTYTVTTHVRGVATPKSIAENELPEAPSLAYGESSFVGWFDNEACSEGHEVTAITSNGDVYAKFEMAETHSYTLDLSAVSAAYTNPHLYAWDANGHNGDFPGVAIVNNEFTVPEGAQLIISDNNPKTKQTINIAQPLNPVAGEALVVCSDLVTEEGEDFGKNKAYWAKDEEAPNGYYLVGTKNNYKFRDATLIPEIVKDASFNVAVLLTGYTAEVDEKVTIRQAKSNVTIWIHSGDPYQGAQNQKDYGYREGDDFKFTVAGTYDIFVHEDSFFVAPHANRHYVSISNVMFAGKDKGETIARPKTLATEGGVFDPGEYLVNNYVQRGYYTDANCTVAYTPAEVTTDDVQLYCKYTKVGYYYQKLTGDFSIDEATIMTSEDIAGTNKAEGSLTVANANDVYAFEHYKADGTLEDNAGLGAAYDFASQVEETKNIKFTKAGSYSVYWNSEDKIYLNGGLDAFVTNFKLEIAAVCETVDTDPNYIQTLQAAWELQKNAYNSLTAVEQKEIKDVGFEGGSDADDLHRMVLKYHRIVTKYGTDTAHGGFEDFIWGQNLTPTNPFRITPTADGNTYLTSIIVLASVVTVSLGAFFIFRKRRHE